MKIHPARLARLSLLIVPFFLSFEFKSLSALRERLGTSAPGIAAHFDIWRWAIAGAVLLVVLLRWKDYLGDARFFRKELAGLFAPPAADGAPGPQRDPFYDNAKFFLVVTVLMNHSIEPFTRISLLFRWLSVFINLITMPMFALLSGRFSRAEISRDALKKIFWRLLAPYLIFQLILIYVDYAWFPEKKLNFSVVIPRFALWYLVSLALWRILLPFFAGLKHPLAVSVFLALLAGFDPHLGKLLALSRTFCFFPFFLAGYYMKGDLARRLKSGALWPLGSLFFLAFVLVANHRGLPFNSLIFHNAPYANSHLKMALWKAPFLNAFVLACSFVLGLTALALIPAKRSIFSRWGVNSLYPYLLHLPVVFSIRMHPLVFAPHLAALPAQLIWLALIIAAGVLLSTKGARLVFRPLVEPEWVVDWLKKQLAARRSPHVKQA